MVAATNVIGKKIGIGIGIGAVCQCLHITTEAIKSERKEESETRNQTGSVNRP